MLEGHADLKVFHMGNVPRTTNQSEIRNQRTNQKLGINKPIRIRNQQISCELERNCLQQLCTRYMYNMKNKIKIRTLQKNEETSGKIHENNTRYPEKNNKRET